MAGRNFKVNYFSFFENYHNVLQALPDESAGRVFKAITGFVFDDVDPCLDAVEMAVFQALKPSLDLSKKRAKAASSKREQTENKTEQTEYKQEQKGIRNIRNIRNKEKDINTTTVSNKSTVLTNTTKKIYRQVEEVVNYLNEKTGSKYRPKTEATATHIRARLKEGFSVDDCKTVIDNMTAEWGDDDKMAAYLRPQTLFSGKFESYLNRKAVQSGSTKAIPKGWGKDYDILKDFRGDTS